MGNIIVTPTECAWKIYCIDWPYAPDGIAGGPKTSKTHQLYTALSSLAFWNHFQGWCSCVCGTVSSKPAVLRWELAPGVKLRIFIIFNYVAPKLTAEVVLPRTQPFNWDYFTLICKFPIILKLLFSVNATHNGSWMNLRMGWSDVPFHCIYCQLKTSLSTPDHPPSVLWHCWLGHMTCKNIVPEWPILCRVGR